MKQQTLAMAADQGAGFEQYRRRTKREDFLDAMNAIVPWAALCAVIEPHYPKAGNGRPPIGLERMLRIHLLQHWFNLADNGSMSLARRSLPKSAKCCKPVGFSPSKFDGRHRYAAIAAKQGGMAGRSRCNVTLFKAERRNCGCDRE